MPAETSPQKPAGRGVIEKNRRQQMKNLYSNLASLLPPLNSKEKMPLPALLNRSCQYVKQLKERVEKLKTEREGLKEDLAVAAVDLHERGPELEVNLVTGLNKGFLLPKVLRVLQEEGAQVLSANYSSSTDRIFYSITSQALYPRIGIDTSKLRERLKLLSGISSVSPAGQATGTSSS
ncbi:OLC1v1028264C3 [Oldenlandia corymbosa var. corymbosa]|nr:OLC1v1028264C3 [Oldenlandia corymbosa var. corymbosa]